MLTFLWGLRQFVLLRGERKGLAAGKSLVKGVLEFWLLPPSGEVSLGRARGDGHIVEWLFRAGRRRDGQKPKTRRAFWEPGKKQYARPLVPSSSQVKGRPSPPGGSPDTPSPSSKRNLHFALIAKQLCCRNFSLKSSTACASRSKPAKWQSPAQTTASSIRRGFSSLRR